jgi:3-oxoadipate enol-lactonase
MFRNDFATTPLAMIRRAQMPRMLVGRVAVGYDDEGEGTPVALIHEFTLDRRMWTPQVPALLAAGYRVLRIDLRGHGDSDAPPTGYAPEDHAGDLYNLFDILGIPSAHIVGLSLGAGVAAAFAEEYPRRVRSLTLINPMLPGRAFGPEMTRLLREFFETAQRGDLDGALARVWAPSRLFWPTRTDSEKAQLIDLMFSRFSPVPFYDRAPHRPGPSVADRLGEIDAPTLVLLGNLDLPDFHAFGEICEREIAGSRLRTIPAGGHLANMDQPEAVNSALIAFFREVDGQSEGAEFHN